jgi:hypothetical protein
VATPRSATNLSALLDLVIALLCQLQLASDACLAARLTYVTSFGESIDIHACRNMPRYHIARVMDAYLPLNASPR